MSQTLKIKSPQNQHKQKLNDCFEYLSESMKIQKDRLTQIIIPGYMFR